MSSKITPTKKYHIDLYKRANLFEKGSWLEKPERPVITLAKKFSRIKNVKVLDLGSGVGRHAIPIAKIIGKNNGKVICVDYLRIADRKLRENAKKYGVEKYIDSYISDVAKFPIRKNNFDLIIAHSVLEHLYNKNTMEYVIKEMIIGTKKGGYNYIFLTTELEEIEISTKNKLKPQIEIYLTTKEAEKLLKKLYKRWQIISFKTVPYKEVLQRNGKNILWKCKYLLLIAKK
jgi:ubiquinone/menaquinone biosynthesis C-methylase UbiE